MRLVAAFFRFGAALRLVAAFFRFGAALRLVAAFFRFGAALRLVAAFFRFVAALRFGAALRLVAAFFLRVVVFFFGAALRLAVVFLFTVVFLRAVVFLVAFFLVAISNLHCIRIAHDEYKQRYTNYQFFFIDFIWLRNEMNTSYQCECVTVKHMFACSCMQLYAVLSCRKHKSD